MPGVRSHFAPALPPDQSIENFGSNLAAELLLQIRAHGGEHDQFAGFGLGPPTGNKLLLLGESKQSVTASAPRFARPRLAGGLVPQLSLQPRNGRPPDAQEGGGFFQTGTEQGGQEHGLGGAELMKVGGRGHERLSPGHQRLIDAARS